jgi:hypothetical protein
MAGPWTNPRAAWPARLLLTAVALAALAASVAAVAGEPASVIGAHDGALSLTGARIAQGAPDSITVVPGPLPAVEGLAPAGEGDAEMTFALDEPIDERATISFWLRPREWYGDGEGRPDLHVQPVEVPQMGALTFQQAPDFCLLLWDWDRSAVEGVWGVGNYVPELPGPEWYHLLVTWDAPQGRLDLYVNGTPQRTPELKLDPWTMTPRGEITLRLGAFQIADVRIGDEYLTPEQARARVPARYRDRHADLFGGPGQAKPMDVQPRLGRLLYESSLGDPAAIEGWVMEGPGAVEFVGGWMQMSMQLVNGEPKGHLVHWCPKDFPSRFVAEWEVRIMSDSGLNIVFFAARGEHGEDIFDPQLPPRNATFTQYTQGAIVSYHISYFANTRATSNLRKNNHFYLVANGPPGIGAGDKHPHRVRLIQDGAHIQLQVDGRVIIDYTDNGKRYGPVLDGGKIGFRQMTPTVARYRNFRVWELRRR